MTEHLQQSWGFMLVATTIRSTQKPSRCLWNDRAWELRVEQTQSQRNITDRWKIRERYGQMFCFVFFKTGYTIMKVRRPRYESDSYLSILIVAITWLSTSNNLEVYASCNIIITGSSWSPPVMTRCFPCVGSLTILFTAVSSQIRSTKKSRCQYLTTFQCWSWDKEIWRWLPGRCVFLLASLSTSLWLRNLSVL